MNYTMKIIDDFIHRLALWKLCTIGIISYEEYLNEINNSSLHS